MIGSSQAQRWATLAAAAVALVATVAVGYQTQSWVRADWYANAYRDRLEQWASGKKPWNEQAWLQAEQSIKAAADVVPNDAGTQDMLGALYTLKAMQSWENVDASNKWFAMAKVSQLKSTELRPYEPHGWANLALTQYALSEPTPQIIDSWRKAQSLGPFERALRPHLYNVAFGLWGEAPLDVKNWAKRQKTLTATKEEKRVFEAWAAYYEIQDLY